MKGARRALDQLDRALASAADAIEQGEASGVLFWLGEAEKVAHALREWINDQPDHTI